MNLVNTFKLGVVAGGIECFIDENGYNGWTVKVIENGLKIVNKKTKQYATWNIYDYDENYAVIENKIEFFLKSQHNH